MRPCRPCRAVLVLLAVVAAASAAQVPPPGLSANDIIRKVTTANAVRTARLRSYHSTRLYEVDYRGFGGDRHAKMTVNIDYQAGKKTFTVVSEDGSKLLLNRVVRKALESEEEAASEEMRRRSALTLENYTFEFVTTEVIDGRESYVLLARPKRKDKYLYEGKVWIDAMDFAIARIASQPAKSPSFWIAGANIVHSNQSVQGIWLPKKTESTSRVRFGGHALLTIDYGKYETLVAD